MQSWEAMGRAIGKETRAQAKALHLAAATLYKWQEPHVDFSDSGAFSPLDRLETLTKTALDLGTPAEDAFAPLFYLCQQFNIFPILLPAVSSPLPDITRQLAKMTAEFGHVLDATGSALADGSISPDERRAIETEAQHLLTALSQLMGLVAKEAGR